MLAEVDALPPDVLRGLFDDAIQGYWDTSTYEAVVPREAEGNRSVAAHRQHQSPCPETYAPHWSRGSFGLPWRGIATLYIAGRY